MGFHRHPSASLVVEARPTLLEEHRCVLSLVLGDPDLRCILGKPCLPEHLAVPSGDLEFEIFTIFRHEHLLRISERGFLTCPNFPAPPCLRP